MGFSAGQVQYLDLIKKDTSKLFNEEVMVGPRVRKCCSSQLPTHILLAVRLQLPGEQCRPEGGRGWGRWGWTGRYVGWGDSSELLTVNNDSCTYCAQALCCVSRVLNT